MAFGALYQASPPLLGPGARVLHYCDTKFVSRAVRKEIVAASDPWRDGGMQLCAGPPSELRTGGLRLGPPEQAARDSEAPVVFSGVLFPMPVIGWSSAAHGRVRLHHRPLGGRVCRRSAGCGAALPHAWLGMEPATIRSGERPLGLRHHRGTPRSAFTDLVRTLQPGLGVVPRVSSAVMTAVGFGPAVQVLAAAGIVQIPF